MALGDNIRMRRERLGWTTHKLAEEVGIRLKRDFFQSNISRYERNDVRPRPDVLRAIAESLGLDPSELEYGSLLTMSVGGHKVPLSDWNNLPTFVNKLPLGPAEMHGFLLTDGHYSNKVFALKIMDDSMAPRFIAGDAILIDPDVKPCPNDFVVAEQAGTSCFRQYKDRGQKNGSTTFELMPANDGYPTLRPEDIAISIIGTMVEHRQYRRR